MTNERDELREKVARIILGGDRLYPDGAVIMDDHRAEARRKADEILAAMPSACPAPFNPAGEPGEVVSLPYRNWRGETAVRSFIPRRLWWGSDEWHPEPQWLLTALDVEKGAERDFALSGFEAAAMPSACPAGGVPEGYVLVPRIPESRAVEAVAHLLDYEGAVELWYVMVAAHAPETAACPAGGVPEGYVLVPREMVRQISFLIDRADAFVDAVCDDPERALRQLGHFVSALNRVRPSLVASGTHPPPACPAGEWRPIERAPKDGTPVDLWSEHGFRVTDCRWDFITSADPDGTLGWTDMNHHGSVDEAGPFSHYMTLPAPPAAHAPEPAAEPPARSGEEAGHE